MDAQDPGLVILYLDVPLASLTLQKPVEGTVRAVLGHVLSQRGGGDITTDVDDEPVEVIPSEVIPQREFSNSAKTIDPERTRHLHAPLARE